MNPWLIGGGIEIVTSAVLTGWVAEQKRRDPVAWFLLGLAVPIVSAVALAGLPALGSPTSPSKSPSPEAWRCPKCLTRNRAEIFTCESCGYTLK